MYGTTILSQTSPPAKEESSIHTLLSVVVLSFSASSAYDLPYFLVGPLRPVVLEVFGLSNVQAGLGLSIIGFSGTIFYLIGGYTADCFSHFWLMVVGLLFTGFGGFYFATCPPFAYLCCLFLGWSITSIMIYWPAYVKSVRIWGDPQAQGWAWAQVKALASLFEAVKMTLIVHIFSASLPKGVEPLTLVEKQAALQVAIYALTASTCLSAALLVICPPSNSDSQEDMATGAASVAPDYWNSLLSVAGNRKLWLMSIIGLSQYFCHGVFDYFPQYAIHGYQFSAVHAAWITTAGMWTRPFIGLVVGWYADRLRIPLLYTWCMSALSIVFILMGFQWNWQRQAWQLITCVVIANSVHAAVSGVFWALLQQADIPISITGTAVGFVSLMSYSPDVFSPPMLGYLMDRVPGYKGDQHCLLTGAAFALLGLWASYSLIADSPKASLVKGKAGAQNDDLSIPQDAENSTL